MLVLVPVVVPLVLADKTEQSSRPHALDHFTDEAWLVWWLSSSGVRWKFNAPLRLPDGRSPTFSPERARQGHVG